MQLKLEDSAYPGALRALPNPPRVLSTSGPLVRRRAIAIVGSRAATREALVYAHDLAFQLASAGIVVVSGGAVGIDGAAHRGAMAAAGGATWVVCPTGKDRLFPPEHAGLFADVASSERSRMLWPFADQATSTRDRLRFRNGVLTALSEGLIVVQAHFQSGSRNAVSWARAMNRRVWAVGAAPWMASFCGSILELEQERARPLWSAAQLFRELGLAGEPPVPPAVDVDGLCVASGGGRGEKNGRAHLSRPPPPRVSKPIDTTTWSHAEKLIFSSTLQTSIHADEIIAQTGLPVGSAKSALLTLSLKDVVVEGPEGFFRRRSAG